MGLNLLGTSASASSYIPQSFSINGAACTVTTAGSTLAAPVKVGVSTAGVKEATDGALKAAVSDAPRWLGPIGLSSGGLRLKQILSAKRSSNLVPGGFTRYELVISVVFDGRTDGSKQHHLEVMVDTWCAEGRRKGRQDVVKLRHLGLAQQ